MSKKNATKIKAVIAFDDDWYEADNDERRDKELEAFNDSDSAKFFNQFCDEEIGRLVCAKKYLLENAYPAYVMHDSNYLHRLLAFDSCISYDIWEKDDDGEWGDGHFVDEPTDLTDKKEALVSAFGEYLTAGAALAKKIGSQSIELWMEARSICMSYLARSGRLLPKTYFSETVVDRLSDLMDRAVKRLQMDVLIQKLPSFDSLRKDALKKSGKKSVKKNAKR